MKEKIAQLRAKSIQEIENAKELKEIEDLRVKILGKKGELTEILKDMKKCHCCSLHAYW